MTFEQMVAEWLRGKCVAVESVESVVAFGTDWAGDTEGGFHSDADVTITYWNAEGARRQETVQGEDMADLWRFVMQAWAVRHAGVGDAMSAEEIDATILRILLGSPHGRRWLEENERRAQMERHLRQLQRSGLDPQIAIHLWTYGDAETIERALQMTGKQVRALNRKWRKRVG